MIHVDSKWPFILSQYLLTTFSLYFFSLIPHFVHVQSFSQFALGRKVVLFKKRDNFFCPSRPIIEPIGDFKTLLARCDVLSRECGRRQFKLAAAGP
jgi:hypothetical protein